MSAINNQYELPSSEEIETLLSTLGVKGAFELGDSTHGIQFIRPVQGNTNPDTLLTGTGFTKVDGEVKIAVPSFDRIEEIQADEISVIPVPGGYNIGLGKVTIYSTSLPTVTHSNEGFAIRVSIINGKLIITYINRILYVSDLVTGEVLTVTKSKWGSAHFQDAVKLLLPQVDKMFNLNDRENKAGLTCKNTYFFSVNFARNQTISRIEFVGEGAVDIAFFGVKKNQLVGEDSTYNPPYISDDDFPSRISGVIGPHHSVTLANFKLDPVSFEAFCNDALRYGVYLEPEDGVGDIRMRTGDPLMFVFPSGKHYRVSPSSAVWRSKMRSYVDNKGVEIGNPSVMDQWYRVMNRDFNSDNFIPLNFPGGVQGLKRYLENSPFLWCRVGESLGEVAPTPEDELEIKFINFILSLPPATQKYAINIWDIHEHDLKNLVVFLDKLQKDQLLFVDPDPRKFQQTGLRSVGSLRDSLLSDFDFPVQNAGNRILDVTKVVDRMRKKHQQISKARGKPVPEKTLVLLRGPHHLAMQVIESQRGGSPNSSRASSSRVSSSNPSGRASSSKASSSRGARKRLLTEDEILANLSELDGNQLYTLMNQAVSMKGYKYPLAKRYF